jgi:ABC-type lipoprotein export system ATPase subunit
LWIAKRKREFVIRKAYGCGINKAGKTVVVVTHDASVAQRCGRTVHILDGVAEPA